MYSLPNVSEIMSTIREKRATYVKQWRVGERQNRRFNTLAADYLLSKYPTIYNEINNFYDSLNSKYTTKHNLTKTKEYRAWKSEQGTGRTTTTTEQETGRTTEQETGRTTEQETGRTTEQETGRTEQETGRTTEQETGRTTEQETGRTTEQEMGRTTEQETGRTTEQETGRTTEQGMGDDHGTPMDIYDLSLDGMDSVLGNLVQELRQDEEIRALMDQPFPFENDQYIW